MKNIAKAVEARESAIAAVEAHASETWKAEALRTVRQLAEALSLFTSETVWDALITKPREPRALGAVMRRAQGAGYIVPLNEWRLAEDPVRHRRPLRVWQSELVPATFYDA